jgi:tRNA U34 5-carboxymethylaminomethyl modifying GTPase MnmE/TrmE
MYKITVAGAPSVGKSCIINEYMKRAENESITICESGSRFDLADSDAVLFVFDLSNRTSLFALDQIYRDFNSFRKSNSLGFLVGNKKDKTREVLVNTATQFALNKQMSYSEISTCNANDIPNLFERILKHFAVQPQGKKSRCTTDRCIHQ